MVVVVMVVMMVVVVLVVVMVIVMIIDGGDGGDGGDVCCARMCPTDWALTLCPKPSVVRNGLALSI
jgi:hypothetical protein